MRGKKIYALPSVGELRSVSGRQGKVEKQDAHVNFFFGSKSHTSLSLYLVQKM